MDYNSTLRKVSINSLPGQADRKTFSRELRGLQSAMKELSLDAGTIVTWDDEAELEGNISVVPAWKWLLEAR